MTNETEKQIAKNANYSDSEQAGLLLSELRNELTTLRYSAAFQSEASVNTCIDGCIAMVEQLQSHTPDLSKLKSNEAIRKLAVAICEAEGMDWGKIGAYDADLFEKQAKAALAEAERILRDE